METYYLYHLSPPENRASILEKGLLARYPSDHHWPYMVSQPKGVYVCQRLGEWSVNAYNSDVWKIDATGLNAVPDIAWPGALILPDDVPPSRLTLIEDVEAEHRMVYTR